MGEKGNQAVESTLRRGPAESLGRALGGDRQAVGSAIDGGHTVGEQISDSGGTDAETDSGLRPLGAHLRRRSSGDDAGAAQATDRPEADSGPA